ncbi:MAG: hypothetical protein KDD50_15130, partial [Bdellovibrionales bacterium]|nr:hypothetical protein [Bdellovibrionales bacterium]
SQKDLPAVSTTHRSLKEIPETTPIMAEGSDPKTLAILNEVKANLNLSQDYEVMRMLIALGYERIKQLFPPKS